LGGRHFEGLAVAARLLFKMGTINKRMKRRLIELDIAFHRTYCAY
jgi:hypothetical protein